MAERNYLLVTWAEASKAYQGNSELHTLSENGGVDLLTSAVITRADDGRIRVQDAAEHSIGLGSLGAGGIGALIGVIGGPLVVLLGFTGGALVGSAFDFDRADTIDSALGQLSSKVPAGTTALIAEVREGSPAAVDQLISKLGGTVNRRNADDVDDEIAAAQDAAQAAADAAAKAVRDRKRAEFKDQVQTKVNEVKEKFATAFKS